MKECDILMGQNIANQTKNSAIADKPRDAFRAFRYQSRSPNIVSFHVSYGFLTVWCRNFVREIFNFKNTVTLKTGLGVHQGH